MQFGFESKLTGNKSEYQFIFVAGHCVLWQLFLRRTLVLSDPLRGFYRSVD